MHRRPQGNDVLFLHTPQSKQQADAARQEAFLAYGPVPDMSAIEDRAQVSRLNRRLMVTYAAVAEERERIMADLLADADHEMGEEFRKWFAKLATPAYANELVEHSVSVYDALRKRGESDTEVQRHIERYLNDNPTQRQRIAGIVADAAQAAGVDFTNGVAVIHLAQFMFNYSASRLLRTVLIAPKNFLTIYHLTQRKAASTAGFTVTDWLMAFITQQQFPEVEDAIQERQNKITVPNFTNAMFDTVRETFETSLYKNMQGGKDAREIARGIIRDLTAAHGGTLPPIPKYKLMLWSRTEGAVMQNDALMKLGDKAKMDGKIWQSVRDAKVRDGSTSSGNHVANDKQGVIPKAQPFADGSMDGGAGSVSPYNCILPGNRIAANVVAAFKAQYTGTAVHIHTADGRVTEVTEQHPVLTPSGFVPAGKLTTADSVLCSDGCFAACPVIQEVYERAKDDDRGAPQRRMDLYGDERFLEGAVESAAFPHPVYFGKAANITHVSAIRAVKRFDYSGEVYDLQTTTGIIFTGGVAVSNCRCAVGPALLPRTKPVPGLPPKTPRKPKPAPTPPPADVTPPVAKPVKMDNGFPVKDDISRLETVKENIGGTTGAKLVRDPDTGEMYILKRGKGGEQIREEFRADELYRALGVDVPESVLYDLPSGPVKLSKFLDNAVDLKTLQRTAPEAYKEALALIQKDFASDALMLNWDVAGLDLDNILIQRGDDGMRAWRIDTGGSLRYRAQGGPKGAAFDQYMRELWTLRTDANAGRVFGGMNRLDVMTSMDGLLRKEEAFLKLLDSMPAELAATMRQRFDYVKKLSGMSNTMYLDNWKPEYIDALLGHYTGMDKAGIFGRMPTELTQSSYNKTVLVDAQGKNFDSLRGAGSITDDFRNYLSANGGDFSLLRRWASSQSGASHSTDSLTLNYWLAQQRDVPLDAYFWYGREASFPNFASALNTLGAKFDATMTASHALNWGALERIAFKYNDAAGGVIGIIRTEDVSVLEAAGMMRKGQSGRYKRTVGASTSVFDHVKATGGKKALTFTGNVPHHRIFMSYLFDDGAGGTMFLSDRENEFYAMLEGLLTTRLDIVARG